MQHLSVQTGLKITVVHLAPVKWNRGEQRLLAFITMNWRGKPLVTDKEIQAINISRDEFEWNYCIAPNQQPP